VRASRRLGPYKTMPWTPYSSAQFTKPLILQMLAVMYRDIGPALSYFFPAATPFSPAIPGASGGAPYLPFVTYMMDSKPIQTPGPALMLVPSSDNADEESQLSLDQDIRLYCAVMCFHQDPNMLAMILQDYVQATRAVWETSFRLTEGDWYATNIPMPPIAGGGGPLFPAGTNAPGLVDTVSGQPGKLKDLWIAGHAFDDLRKDGPLFGKQATMLIKAHLDETDSVILE
jgi:hypothetical protein